MNQLVHEEIARQRHRDACLEARRVRMVRAISADRRARQAIELAVRACERAGTDRGQLTLIAGR